jgi:hypothetical protein
LKSAEEIMQILEAFDLTRSFRDAGELVGCDHKTVAVWVARRDAGAMSAKMARRAQLIDPFLPKLEEWMEASRGKVRADVAHEKLVAMGFAGSERTTRRAVAAVRRRRSAAPAIWSARRSVRTPATAIGTPRGTPGVGSIVLAVPKLREGTLVRSVFEQPDRDGT